MSLTLNDFRSVLGYVNDGNVVFKGDDAASGIEKANHGNVISRKLYGYRQVPSDPVKNQQIRQALMDAISNSEEGRTLSDAQIRTIRTMLGLGQARASEALGRKELKAVIDTVELMVRGEKVPSDGRIPKGTLKNIPMVDGNRLVQRQIDSLYTVGYDPKKCQSLINIVKEHTQNVSRLLNKDELEKIFEKGFEGHDKKEMLIFTRNSASHIQSQIFDKLLWKYMDAIENSPKDQTSVRLESGKLEDVFLEVVHEMMSTYAQKAVPGPAVDRLLESVPATMPRRMDDILPTLGDPDSTLAKAGTEFLTKVCSEVIPKVSAFLDDMDARFSTALNLLTPSKFDFESRQMRNFVAQLKNEFVLQRNRMVNLKDDLFKTFAKVYGETPGDFEAKQKAAMDAVAKMAEDFKSDSVRTPLLALLNRFSVKQLSAFAANTVIAGGIYRSVADKLGRLPAEQGRRLDAATIQQVFGGTILSFAREDDLNLIASALAKELGIAPDDAQKMRNVIDALADGGLDDYVVGVQTKVVELRVNASGPNANPSVDFNTGVELFVKDQAAFVDAVKAKLAASIDFATLAENRAKAAEQARAEQFTTAGRLKTSWGEHKPVVDEFIFTRAQRDKSLSTSAKNVTDLKGKIAELEQKQPRTPADDAKLASLRTRLEKAERNDLKEQERMGKYDEKYYKIVEDPVFRGKLALATQCGLLDNHAEAQKLLFNSQKGKYVITPDNAARAKEIMDEVFTDRSLDELKMLTTYCDSGLADRDADLVQLKRGFRPFLGMLKDGQLDFPGAGPKARDCLLDNLNVTIQSKVVSSRQTGFQDRDIDPERHMSDETFKTYYREVRQAIVDAVTKENAGRSAKKQVDLAAILADSGFSDEEPKADYRFNASKYSHVEDGRFSVKPFKTMRGFATEDPKTMCDLLARVGVRPQDLDTPEAWMKFHRLSVIVWAHGGQSEGAVEWAERVTGKSFDEIRYGDLFEITRSAAKKMAIPDPIDSLKGDLSTVARYVSGQITLDEAKLKPAEMPKFLEGLRTIASGKADSAEVSLFGNKLTVSRTPNGALTARLDVGAGKTMSVSVARALPELIAQIENQVADHASQFTADQIRAVLPPPPKGDGFIARPRELYSKTLASLLGLPSVSFAHLSTADMYAKVAAAADADANGRTTLAREFSEPSKNYNSTETVELQEKYLASDLVTRALVKLPPPGETRTVNDRLLVPPKPAEVSNFVAELIMNADTWAYDEGMKTPGKRIFDLVQAYGPEITHLKNTPDLRKTLPTFLQAGVGAILDELEAIARLDDDKAKLEKCAALEKRIDTLVTNAMVTMQTEAKALFGASRGNDRKTWQKGLGEMNGSDGLSQVTSQGRFNKRILDNYFVRCDPTEKRAMLANLIRNTDDKSSSGKRVGEMLKGAGPLLQKMLQGISANTFGPETRLALKDMKSKLLPISDSVIKANLLELIRSSNGEILSIDVKKPLGQATVGEALLCHIRTKDHPVGGEDVVIKILRPNVQTAVQREFKVFNQIAKELDAEEQTGTAQQETFKGRYETVLKEFDFTLESANIDLCMGVYDKPTAVFGPKKETVKYDTIHSMDRYHGVAPTTGAIILQKVEGKPVDRMIEDVQDDVAAIVADFKDETQAGEGAPKVTVYKAKSASELARAKIKLWNKRAELTDVHAELKKLVDIWFDRALFGDGVFHNDLHPGNVMINGRQVSVIDFGNVGRLSKEQQDCLVFMFAGAMSGSAEDFLKGVESLLGNGIDKASGLRDRLKGELEEIFAKGSSDDVLPRMLGALSTLKDFSIPVPEVIHNFAESMSRLQTVVDSVADEIAEIEFISGEITLASDETNELKLDEKWNRLVPEGFEVFDELNRALKTLGTPGRKFDPQVMIETVAQVRAKFNGGGLKTQIENLLKKAFKEPDGGIEFLRDLLAMLKPLPCANVNGGSTGEFRAHVEDVGATLVLTVDNYEKALKAADPDPEAIKTVRNDLVIYAKDVFEPVLNGISLPNTSGASNDGPTIFKPSNAEDFVHCVGTSLADREDLLKLSLARQMNIEEKKFNKVMEMFENGANEFAIGWEAGKDSFKFWTLKGLGDKISDSKDEKKKIDNRIAFLNGIPVESGGDMKIDKVLSRTEMRKIESCAREFRCPSNWRKETDAKKARENLLKKPEDIRLVFQTNLDALKTALGVEALTDMQILHFARVSASATRSAAFAEFLVGADEGKLNELANGSDELKRCFTVYKESIDAIIEEANREE